MRRMRRKNFDNLFDEMENLFSDFQEKSRNLAGFANIPVDIREENGHYELEADLPGVSKEDINLKADSEKVEISAESSEEVKEENEKYYRQERSQRSFRRSVAWPSTVDAESIHAEFDDGVLTVTAEREDSDGRDVEIE